MRWQVDSRVGTRVLGLSIKAAPQGAQVRVTCRGRGCPSKALAPKLKNGDLAAGAIFKRRWLRPGAVIEIQVARADMISEVVRYTVRSGGKYPKRSDLCLMPGAKKPARC